MKPTLSPPSRRSSQRAVVVAKLRSVRRTLERNLVRDGYEVIALESVDVLPWLAPSERPIAMVVIEGSMMETLAAVDELRLRGIQCPVRIHEVATATAA